MKAVLRNIFVLCFFASLIGLTFCQDKATATRAKDPKDSGASTTSSSASAASTQGTRRAKDTGSDTSAGAATSGKEAAATQGKASAATAGKDGGGAPQGSDHVIVVGAGAKVFSPPTIDAQVGDTVTFEFHPKAHTVSQSFFEDPCKLASKGGAKGFHSGLTPVKPDTKSSELPRWTMKIEVVTPIWFFCAAPGHCAAGMVGAINAPKSGEKNFAKFQELAQSSGNSSDTSKSLPDSNELASSGGKNAKATDEPANLAKASKAPITSTRSKFAIVLQTLASAYFLSSFLI